MALFRYIAVSGGEPPAELMIEADSEEEALGKLRSRKLTPVRFLGEAMVGQSSGFSLRRSGIDTFALTRQLAPLLSSFIPLERALGIIADSSDNEQQRTFINSLRQGLHEGKKFSELVRSNGALFPDYYANLVESGEESGCLPEVLNQLYKFMDESKSLKSFILSSSIYPAAILTVTTLVVILLFTVFVPKFTVIFVNMGREIPPSMTFLLTISAFMKWAWWLVPCLAAGTVIGIKKYWGDKEFEERKGDALLRLPLIGRIAADLEMCRYIRTLSIMINNHVEIIRTVRITGRIIHNPVIRKAFAGIDAKLRGGDKLSSALSGNPFVPKEMVPMLRVGEESGSVGPMLVRIADNLEGDTRMKIKRLLSLFEPVVILFLAAVVLVVVVSIFSAMMDLNAIK